MSCGGRPNSQGLDEAVRFALRPSAVQANLIGYLVLATTVALEAFALEIGLRPVREQAAGRPVSLRTSLHRSTDPASTTNVGGGFRVRSSARAVDGKNPPLTARLGVKHRGLIPRAHGTAR